MLIKISEETYINLNHIVDITLSKEKNKYKWNFTCSKDNEYMASYFSKEFNTEEEASKWLEHKLNKFVKVKDYKNYDNGYNTFWINRDSIRTVRLINYNDCEYSFRINLFDGENNFIITERFKDIKEAENYINKLLNI